MQRRVIIYLLSFWICFLVSACHEAQPKLRKLPADGIILAVGDSLTSGVGTTPDSNYPTVLGKLINMKVVNVGMPGAESKDILQSITQLINDNQPNLIILMIGGNDMIRKRPHEDIKSNLQQIIKIIKQNGIQLILIAEPSPSIRPRVPEFYQEVAEETNIPVDTETVPTLLGDNQYKSDYIHLNKMGYEILAQKIAALLKEAGGI